MAPGRHCTAATFVDESYVLPNYTTSRLIMLSRPAAISTRTSGPHKRAASACSRAPATPRHGLSRRLDFRGPNQFFNQKRAQPIKGKRVGPFVWAGACAAFHRIAMKSEGIHAFL